MQVVYLFPGERRVPLALRGAQQRITPDVQIGCVSCASGDGRFGGPVWWNTPLGDEDAAPEEHRAQWAQPVRAVSSGFTWRRSVWGSITEENTPEFTVLSLSTRALHNTRCLLCFDEPQ